MLLNNHQLFIPFTTALLLLLTSSLFRSNYEEFVVTARLIESERMKEYHRRNHSWPPKLEDYTPPLHGWKNITERWFQQLQYTAEESTGERYEAFMGAIHSALMSKNFTEYGWGITKAPNAIVKKLKKRLYDGLNKENKILVPPDLCIETDLLPYLIEDEKMNHDILFELLPLFESWSGVELIANNAYGLRVYRNNSNLLMHLDKQDTHVISGILHVDHGIDDVPWPLVIEDFHGNTNEVFLEPGDLLFYESSKCRHGRPEKYNGEFYSSLFMHFYPKYDWQTEKRRMDIHYRIPDSSIWRAPSKRIDNDGINELKLVELCLKEPECKHEWCGLKDTVKWTGTNTEYGKVISNDRIPHELKNIPKEEDFEHRNNYDEL